MATKDVNIAITASDKTSAAFSSVQRSLGGLKTATSSVTSAVGGLTAAFAAIGAGAFIKGTIDAADNLAKLSQKTTVAVEDLSALANSANLAGVSNDQLGVALIKLNKNIAEAVSGTREQVDAFRGLGISVKDAEGNIRPVSDVLNDVADRFSRASDGAVKTQYAMALFGKAGADLIPFLNQGRDGMRQFGSSIGADFAKQAEMFNDNIEKMGQSTQKFLSNAGTPILTWINAFVSIVKGEGATGALSLSPLQIAKLRVYELSKEVEKLSEATLKPNGIFMMSKFKDKLDQLAVAKQRLADLTAEQKKSADTAKSQGGDLVAMPNQEIVKALESANDEIKKLINGETEMKVLQFQRLGASDKQVEKYRELIEQAKILTSQDKQLEDIGKTIDELQKKRVDLEKEAKKEYEGSLSVLGKTNIEMAKYASWRSQGLITADQEFELLNQLFDKTEEFNQTIKTEGFGAAMERGMRVYYNSIKDISGLMEDSVVRAFQGMEDALVNFVKTGKLDFTDFANSVINDLIRIQVRQSITQPLSQAMSGGVSSFVSSLFGTQAPAPVVNASAAVPAFAGGGYTGSGARSGGVDGMGGFPAILHPNESVIDHSMGQSSGVIVNQTINLSAGVSQTVRAEVMSMMPRIMDATKSAVADAKRRGGSFGKAMA